MARKTVHDTPYEFEMSVGTNDKDEVRNLSAIDVRRMQAEKVIEIIASLPENWNRKGAPTIPSDLIRRARDVLSRLPYIPSISPTAMPGIQMDYEDGGAGYLEFELLGDGRVEMYFEDVLREREIEKVITDAELPGMVQKFYAQGL